MKHLFAFELKSTLMISLIMFCGNAWATDLEVPYDYDSTWLKTVQAIALQGVELSATDKESGIIQGSKSFDKDSKYFNCPTLRGRATSYSYNISATVRGKDESSSLVSVQVEGVRKSYRNRHFIFITTGRVHTEAKCESTGELEKLLMEKISKP